MEKLKAFKTKLKKFGTRGVWENGREQEVSCQKSGLLRQLRKPETPFSFQAGGMFESYGRFQKMVLNGRNILEAKIKGILVEGGG